MDLPKAIVVAAVILGVSFVLGNLHRFAPGHDGGIYRVNTVTGDMMRCEENMQHGDPGRGHLVCVWGTYRDGDRP